MTHKAYQTGVAHVNNTELYYEVVGSGHPLTLIHGMLLDRRSWDDQFEVFARQYTVVRYDMRGWGDSAQEQAEPPFSPRQDLLSLLDYLNIHKTSLLGLSGGGALALDFTLEHPDTVDALILVASGLSGYPQRMTETIRAFIGQYYGAVLWGVAAERYCECGRSHGALLDRWSQEKARAGECAGTCAHHCNVNAAYTTAWRPHGAPTAYASARASRRQPACGGQSAGTDRGGRCGYARDP